MAGRDPFRGRVRQEKPLVEDDLLVLAAELAEARLQPLADRPEGARDPADAVDMLTFGLVSLGWTPASGRGLHEEVLDHLGHQPALLGLGRLADDGREVQLPLGQPFQRRVR